VTAAPPKGWGGSAEATPANMTLAAIGNPMAAKTPAVRVTLIAAPRVDNTFRIPLVQRPKRWKVDYSHP
jgi:hypothetical protein